MVLCFVPKLRGLEEIPLILRRSIPTDMPLTIAENILSREEWHKQCQGAEVAIAWIATSDDAGTEQESALIMLSEAVRQGVPTIALGATLNRSLMAQLVEMSIGAYVSAGCPSTFASALAEALAAVLRDQTTMKTRFHNIGVELMLRLSGDSITWIAYGSGYMDEAVLPHATAWVNPMLYHIADSYATGLTRQKLRHIGEYLGASLVSSDGHDFYTSVWQVTAGDEPPRLLVSTPPEWSMLPFEVAFLPIAGQTMGALHPITRVHQGIIPRRSWYPPRDRGLRILLVGSDAKGRAKCPHGLSCSRLRGLKCALKEIKSIYQIFHQASAVKPGLVEHVECITGAEATLVNVEARLTSSHWDIIHFAGHGAACTVDDCRTGCIFLRKAPGPLGHASRTPDAVPIEWCASILARETPGSLVYLSCCKSADNGLLRILASSKPCEVVGYQSGVDDEAAHTIAGLFYSELLRCLMENNPCVDLCMLRARRRVAAGSDQEWLAAALSSLWIGDSRTTSSAMRPSNQST